MNTIKNLLKTALLPVGKTMYIYGGGWNYDDSGAGKGAMTKGLLPEWIDFSSKQTENYNFREYNYKRDFSVTNNGLDCSAYIGWIIYNVFGNKYSNSGYVFKSAEFVERLSLLGLGNVIKNKDIKRYTAGSILSSACNHVWLCVGQCSDNSVVLLHSSPPGVMISGTCDNNKKSDAIVLAKRYMKKYYPGWYCRYHDISRDNSYLSEYDMFEWDSKILNDTEGYKNLTADKILSDLLKED
jgi:hypothetical protein